MANELSTIDTYLLTGTGTPLAYTNLCKIKDYPDLGGDVDEIEVTDLSDTRRRYIAGIKNNDKMEFTANYTYSDFNTIQGKTGLQHIRVAFGYTSGSYGTDGYFDFDGYINVRVTGKGVNEAREMVISIIVNSDITAGQTT